MKAFRDGQRVRVNEMGHPLNGIAGTVVRSHLKDDGAWVSMDEQPKDVVGYFPFGGIEGDSRQNHALLFPNECEAA